MDATAWGAIGGGLSALSEGLTAMQLRKLAKQREDEERERQKEEAALRKAQLKAQEFQSMDSRNFKKVSENGQVTNKANANALLNAAAFGRGGEQVKGDISGDTYFRGAGDSPADQARAKEEARIQAAMERLQTETASRAEIARLKDDLSRMQWRTQSKNNEATNASRVQGLQITVGGANERANVREDGDVTAQKRAMMADFMKPVRQEDGSYIRMPMADAKAAVDEIFGTPAPAAKGGLRKATDDEFRQGMKESGNDPVNMRAWLKQRGLTE